MIYSNLINAQGLQLTLDTWLAKMLFLIVSEKLCFFKRQIHDATNISLILFLDKQLFH